MKLVITCMDRRLNGYVDERNSGDTLALRNAGANVNGLQDSINKILNNENIKEIDVVTHTDCGAMKVVFGALNEGMKASDGILSNLVGQFSGLRFASREELEAANGKVQDESIGRIAEARGIKYTSELLDVSKLAPSSSPKEHKLFIMKPTSKKYEELIGGDLESAYVIEAENIDEISSDIEIAVKNLGISDIVFVANGPAEYRQVSIDASRLGMKPFMEGTKVSFLRI